MSVKTSRYIEDKDGDLYSLIPPKSTETELGGIKAKTKTDEDVVDVLIDDSGNAYADVSEIKQDIAALESGKADTSHSHTTADLTDWIPMSTAVKTALTDTTAPTWTATEQASARARLGAEKAKGEWVLKGTIAGNADDRGNIDTGVTVDLSGCTELVLKGNTVGTSNATLMVNGGINLLSQIAVNGNRFFIVSCVDSLFYFDTDYIYNTTQTLTSKGISYKYPDNPNSPKTVSDIVKIYFSNTSVVTSCNIKIYAR